MIEELKTTQGLLPLILSWKETCKSKELEMEANPLALLLDFKKIIGSEQGVLFGTKNKNDVIGVIGVIIFSSPIGNDLIANEHYWYVMPEYRKGTIGMRLLKKAIKWAESKGCTHFMGNASMLASDLHDNICSIYERIGMKKFETTYIMKIGE